MKADKVMLVLILNKLTGGRLASNQCFC